MLALFIIVLSVIISIGGSSGGQPQAPAENRPLVQAPVPVTATVGIGGLQPNGPRGTEPQPPPRPTTTDGENAAPTQQP
jgi:hypothetical protein